MKLKAQGAYTAGLGPELKVETEEAGNFIIYSLHILGAKKESLEVKFFTVLRNVRVFHKGTMVWEMPLDLDVNDGDVKAEFANGVLKIRIPTPKYNEKKIDTEEAGSSLKPADDGQKKQAQEECSTSSVEKGHKETASSPVHEGNQKEHLPMVPEQKQKKEEAVKSSNTKREGSGSITEASVIYEADRRIVAERKNGKTPSNNHGGKGNATDTIDQQKIGGRQLSGAGIKGPNFQNAKTAERICTIPAPTAGVADVKKGIGESGMDANGKRVEAENHKLEENKRVSEKIINGGEVLTSLPEFKGRNGLTEGEGDAGSRQEAGDKFQRRTCDMTVPPMDDWLLFVNISAALFVLVGLSVWVLRSLHLVHNH